jgi:glycosyltransferase involved in cell wall biosynthesis
MRVQYSHHIFSTQEVGGISNYFVDLAAAMCDQDVSIQMKFPLTMTRSLQNSFLFNGKVVPSSLIKRGVSWRVIQATNTASEYLRSKHLTEMSKADIFHRTYYSTSGNHRASPEVLTVYDMIHEDHPEYFRKAILKDKLASLQRASEVICISEFTRQRLLHHTDTDPNKVTVIPLGVDQKSSIEISKRPTGGPPYILYIGNRNGYKNFDVLALAFSELHLLFNDLELLVVGGGPISEREQNRLFALGISKRVHYVDSPAGVDELIRKAQCVVSTSLVEGFGLVPLESLGLGTPCVVTDIQVNREIWGDALPRFIPDSYSQLATAIQLLLESDSHWKMVAENGMKVAQTLSVNRMAEATMAVYERAAKSSKSN